MVKMSERYEEILLLVLLIRKRRKVKKLHVHTILLLRETKGLFHSLFDKLCEVDNKFFNYMTMSKSSYIELLSL